MMKFKISVILVMPTWKAFKILKPLIISELNPIFFASSIENLIFCFAGMSKKKEIVMPASTEITPNKTETNNIINTN